jgi:hypothetical protein
MHTFVIISTLKQVKITLYTPTCFGPRRDHPQGVAQCLAKTMYMVFCAGQCRRGQCYGSISTVTTKRTHLECEVWLIEGKICIKIIPVPG